MESSAYTGAPTVGAMAEYDDEYDDDTEEEADKDGKDNEIGLCLSPVTKVKMEGNVYERGTARGPRTPGEDGSAAAGGDRFERAYAASEARERRHAGAAGRTASDSGAVATVVWKGKEGGGRRGMKSANANGSAAAG